MSEHELYSNVIPILDCSLAKLARFILLELHGASKFPAIAELWFLAFNASVEIHPVMLSEDLARPRGIPSASRREDDPFPLLPSGVQPVENPRELIEHVRVQDTR